MYSVKNASGKKSPKPNLAKSNIEQINTFLQLINLPKLYFMYNCNVLLNANFLTIQTIINTTLNNKKAQLTQREARDSLGI